MAISENNTDPKGIENQANQPESTGAEKQVEGSDADADRNVGKINDIPADLEKDKAGSDADTDHGGKSSV